MNKPLYDNVAELVSKLIEATRADELIWVGSPIFGSATAHRNGISYALDFPSKTMTDRALFVDEEQVWHGSELNELVVAVSEQWKRCDPKQPPQPETGPDEKVVSGVVGRALKTF